MNNTSKKIFLLISLLMINKPSLRGIGLDKDTTKIIVGGAIVGASALYALYRYAFAPITPTEETQIQEEFIEKEAASKIQSTVSPLADEIIVVSQETLQKIISKPNLFGYRADTGLPKIKNAEEQIEKINTKILPSLNQDTKAILELNTLELFNGLKNILKTPAGSAATLEIQKGIKNAALKIQAIYNEQLNS